MIKVDLPRQPLHEFKHDQNTLSYNIPIEQNGSEVSLGWNISSCFASVWLSLQQFKPVKETTGTKILYI